MGDFPANFPGAVQVPVQRCPGLSWADTTDQRRGLLHSTESDPGSIPGAVSSYNARGSAPHVTADPVRGAAGFSSSLVQHVPMTAGAYALRNGDLPMQTNRDRYTWQVEIIGRAANMADLPAPALAWLADHVIRPLHEVYGVPAVSLTFHAYPPPVRLGTEPWRLTPSQWLAYSGFLGHQHAPDGNVHGDPGALAVPAMLDSITEPPPPGDQPMTAEQLAKILDAVSAVGRGVITDIGESRTRDGSTRGYIFALAELLEVDMTRLRARAAEYDKADTFGQGG